MNYAKRFYNLTTDPCSRAGSMGKSNADEMDFWTLDEYLICVLRSYTGPECVREKCLLLLHQILILKRKRSVSIKLFPEAKEKMLSRFPRPKK